MKITDNVYEIRLSRANSYLLMAEQNILVDTGMPYETDKLIQKIYEIGVSPDLILLTHYDVDHIGGLDKIGRYFNIPAYINAKDYTIASGQKSPTGIKNILRKFLRVQTYERLDSLLMPLSLAGITGIETGGHTLGHTIFKFDDCLLSGDLFKIKNNEVIPMNKSMNLNNTQMSVAIEMILNINSKWICPSHGTAYLFDNSLKKQLKKVSETYAKCR